MNAQSPQSGSNLHLATLAFGGALWEAYLDFENDPRRPVACRARIRFEPPAEAAAQRPTQTTVIIIEDSYEEAVAKARGFDDRQLQGLLRSTLPDESADASD
jgi:hypothetical protein